MSAPSSPVLYALPVHRRLASDLPALTRLEAGSAIIDRFSNGELQVELDAAPAGRDCVVLGAVAPPEEHLLATLLLSHTVSLAGGAIGIVVGIVGAWAIGYFAGWPAPIQARAVVPAFVFAAAVGVFFGFYPARKASRLNPIDARRYE